RVTVLNRYIGGIKVSNEHRDKWNKRYREGGHHTKEDPSSLLKKWVPRLSPGRALDLGCGAGRNALFLASKGYDVDAIDYSEVALKIGRSRARERGLEVNWIHSDIEKHSFLEEVYDLINVSFFHSLDSLPSVKKSLKDDGIFIYEHHLSVKEDVDRGPKSAQVRFRPNELLDIFSDYQVLYYTEGIETNDGEKSAKVRIVCRKSSDFEKDLPPISDL
ncbi:MAG: class I SAM-dependent methyltransferase, partial [Candidatus Aenigmatarchaeota archaeon]